MGAGSSTDQAAVPKATGGTYIHSVFSNCPIFLVIYLSKFHPLTFPMLLISLSLFAPLHLHTQTTGSGPDVILNIYEPTQGQSSVMGMGIYHTGIEISGVEYAYGGGSVSASGVYTQTPREAPPGSSWKFKLAQPLGKAKVPYGKIASEMDKVGAKFKGMLLF